MMCAVVFAGRRPVRSRWRWCAYKSAFVPSPSVFVGGKEIEMKTVLGWLGAGLLFLDTAFMYLSGVVVASFRGDQLVAVYPLQWGAIVLALLLIAAVVARTKRKPVRSWLVAFAGLTVALLLATIVSWHIIDRRECPAYPETPGGCFNPQLRELE